MVRMVAKYTTNIKYSTEVNQFINLSVLYTRFSKRENGKGTESFKFVWLLVGVKITAQKQSVAME